MASFLQQAAGKAGRAIDIVGGLTGNFLPELNFSESLQAYGGNKSGQPFAYVPPNRSVQAANTYDPDAVTRAFGSTNQYGANVPPPPPSGGGGGGGGQVNRGGWNNTGFQDQGAYDLARAMREEQERLPGQVDSLYNESYGLLDKQEQDLRGGEQNFYNSFTGEFDAQKPILEQGFNQGQQLLGSQRNDVQQSEANALSAARRLYQELTQGVRQRFGGSNSAGEFAQQFFGREYQRNMGNIQNSSGQNMKALQEKAVSLQQNYSAQLQALTAQKESALAQARDVFQQRIAAINNARLGLAQNKAQLKLQALQEMRSNIQNVQAQALQFQQQLQMTVAQAQAQLAANIQGYNANAGKAVDLSAIPQAAFSQFGGGMQTPGSNLQTAFGSFGRDDEKNRPYA